MGKEHVKRNDRICAAYVGGGNSYDIADDFGISASRVLQILHRRNVKVRRISNGRAWSDSHVAFLEVNWRRMLVADIAKHLGRTRNSVIGRADRMELPKLTDAEISERGSMSQTRRFAREAA